VVFLLNVLDGFLIENMPVGKFRHGHLFALPVFHFPPVTGV
jgi:hypothetical protein